MDELLILYFLLHYSVIPSNYLQKKKAGHTKKVCDEKKYVFDDIHALIDF